MLQLLLIMESMRQTPITCIYNYNVYHMQNLSTWACIVLLVRTNKLNIILHIHQIYSVAIL